jgi:DinB family protein
VDFQLPDAIAVLSHTPHALNALLADLPPCWTDATEGEGTWSPRIVVTHLLGAERTNWIPRARIILGEGPRALPPLHPAAQVREMPALAVPALLAALTRERAGNLALLDSWHLDARQLDRTAVHPEFGTVSLRQLIATWAVHDLAHLAQIARVMASQYRGAVGPWVAYLRILQT